MIKTETITINGKEFIRTYSNRGFMVERDGIQYDEAIDPVGTGRIYTESDIISESYRIDDELEQKAHAYDILTGVIE
jgi:hypothetical protein